MSASALTLIEAPGEVLSPSQASTFMGCPAKWMFRKVLHLPDPPTGAATLGSAVHAAIGANFEQKLDTRHDLPLAGVLGLFRYAWDALVAGVYPGKAGRAPSLPTEFRDDENPDDLKKQGEALVRLYMDDIAPSVDPQAVELPVAGRIGGVAVRGIVDVLDVSGKVIDLKTAARKPSEISADYRFQVATYAQLTPGASGIARLDTLTKTKTPAVHSAEFTIDQADVDQTARLYPAVQSAMRAQAYYPNRNHWACSRSYCSFWRACQQEFGGKIPE